MRVEKAPDDHVIGVVLSRRNLLTLIAKLDGVPEDSACTILAPIQYGPFFVKAEEDAEHYHHPEREAQGEAGVMHPATERVLSDVKIEAVSAVKHSPFGTFVSIPAPTE